MSKQELSKFSQVLIIILKNCYFNSMEVDYIKCVTCDKSIRKIYFCSHLSVVFCIDSKFRNISSIKYNLFAKSSCCNRHEIFCHHFELCSKY